MASRGRYFKLSNVLIIETTFQLRMSLQYFGCVRVYAFCSSLPRLLPSILFVCLFCALVFELSHSTCGLRTFFEHSATNLILHVAFERSLNARPQKYTHCISAPSAQAPNGRWRHSNCLSESSLVYALIPRFEPRWISSSQERIGGRRRIPPRGVSRSPPVPNPSDAVDCWRPARRWPRGARATPNHRLPIASRRTRHWSQRMRSPW